MVSRILISIALLCSSVAMSQDENGLTFSQVLLVELTEEGVVVPEGKVWKVMSHISTLPGGSDDDISSWVRINGVQCDIHRYNFFSNASTSASNNIFPMWLPSGTNLSSGDMVSALSIIEFNTD